MLIFRASEPGSRASRGWTSRERIREEESGWRGSQASESGPRWRGFKTRWSHLFSTTPVDELVKKWAGKSVGQWSSSLASALIGGGDAWGTGGSGADGEVDWWKEEMAG